MQIVDISLGSAHAQGYLHDFSESMPHRKARPCVVICPGGGYQHVSDREKDPPAFALLSAGFQVFHLRYSVGEASANLQPLSELASLILKIRENAEAWGVQPDKIAVMGYSAGGHLAASMGTLWHTPELSEKLGRDASGSRPDAMILCYPVITSNVNAHRGSILNVSGGDAAWAEFFSLEKQVRADTPPAFLWHTQDDAAVPVENTLLMCDALRKHGVSFEAHIFEHGTHGLSMCTAEVGKPNVACMPWFSLMLTWLANKFEFEM